LWVAIEFVSGSQEFYSFGFKTKNVDSSEILTCTTTDPKWGNGFLRFKLACFINEFPLLLGQLT